MSTALTPRPRAIVGKRTFVLVASQFNARYVQGLVNHATEEFRTLAPGAVLTLHQVPGAFEVPIVVREVAVLKKPDAILAIAVILKGQTSHAHHLSHSVTNALMTIAIESGIPVINVVLEMETEDQARERCLEKKINRGTEAARAAVEISNIMSELRKP